VTVDLRPWRRLLPIWLPAVGLCAVAATLYLWQSSESGGRAAGLRSQIEELEAEKARLEGLLAQVEGERATVAAVNESFDLLYGQVFRGLDDRLTNILREVGLATRSAGLLPGSYKYDAEEDQKTGYVRFSIQFSVTGEYAQIRKLIAAVQSSPEFLVVEQIAFTGDEAAATSELTVAVRVATYLSEANRETLDRLTGGIRGAAVAGDAEVPAGDAGEVPADAGVQVTGDADAPPTGDAGAQVTGDGDAQVTGGGDAEAEG
jgi:Tfp pilus assembly protein PilO